MRSASRPLTANDLPSQPFFRTPEQRVALARQRFFEEHEHPAGLVSEAVVQSWSRSRSLGHARHQRPSLEPVNRSAIHQVLARNRRLLDAAQSDLQQLEATLAGTACRVLLTDATGVIVHVTDSMREAEQQVLNMASRVGVNLAESQLGTNAPGIVARTGMACTVQGCEHFYDVFQAVRCAAAPIRDVSGRVVGVLDVSTESRDFGFDAASVVGVYATSIENRLLQAQSDEHLVLHFQASPVLLGTPMEGLAGVSANGEVVWINGVGRRLLGRPVTQAVGPVEELLGTHLQHLLALCGADAAQRLQLPSGLGIWVRVALSARDGVDFRHAVTTMVTGPTAPQPEETAPAPTSASPDTVTAASLASVQHKVIEDTLQANGGNVARTARQLGVSRGLVYRHLRR